MAINVHSHLDRAVPHLIPYVSERRTRLDEQTSKGVTQVVEADLPDPGTREEGLEDTLAEVVHLDWRPRLRGEDEFIRDLCLTFGESLDELLVAEF
jgi:hypothetical protein